MEFTDTTNTSQVTLLGKVHDASPTRWTRDGAGQKVAHPVCGQRSRNWFPSYLTGEAETTCEKCLAARPATGPTAVRTVEGGKATITVTFPGWPTQTLSGVRAARAEAVLITDQTGPPKLGCRANLADAVAEAERMTSPRVSRTRYGKVPMPARPTVAIQVTDA